MSGLNEPQDPEVRPSSSRIGKRLTRQQYQSLKNEIAEMKAQHQAEMKELNEQHEAKMKKLQEQHEAEMKAQEHKYRALEEQLEIIKTTLLTLCEQLKAAVPNQVTPDKSVSLISCDLPAYSPPPPSYSLYNFNM